MSIETTVKVWLLGLETPIDQAGVFLRRNLPMRQLFLTRPGHTRPGVTDYTTGIRQRSVVHLLDNDVSNARPPYICGGYFKG